MSSTPLNTPEDARAARTRRAETRQAMADERERRGRNRPWRKKIRGYRRKIGRVLTRLVAPSFLRVMSWTWRVERHHFERYEQLFEGEGFLIALWHGEMLGPLPLHLKRPVSVLVSQSGDGSVATILLQRFGFEVVRGSTSRGSARALRELRMQLKRRRAVVITPDGPRGPRHSVNLGTAWLAREAGCPILPLHIDGSRGWRLKSWDKFLIPKPFAKLTLTYTEPISVPKEADDLYLERCTEQLRIALMQGHPPAET